MSSAVKSSAPATECLHRNRPALLPWQTAPQTRRALLWSLVAALLLACFISGYHKGQTASQREYAGIIATGNYYLPVDSRQLTVAVVPLIPGPQALDVLRERDSSVAKAAGRLTSGKGLDALAANLGELYPLGYRVADPLTIPDEFFSVERQQYRADQVLNWLAKTADRADFRSVGVVPYDIYKPGFNFLFGLAKTGGNACIASAARMGRELDGARLTADQRWHSIVRHELGHTLGLLHNETEQSVMVYGNSLNELDRQEMTLTAAEWSKLEQIHPIIWHR